MTLVEKRRRNAALFSSAADTLYLEKSASVRARRLKSCPHGTVSTSLGTLTVPFSSAGFRMTTVSHRSCSNIHPNAPRMIRRTGWQSVMHLMLHETWNISCKDQVLNLGGLSGIQRSQSAGVMLSRARNMQQNSVLCVLMSKDRWRGGASKRMSLNTADLCAKTPIDNEASDGGLSLSPLRPAPTTAARQRDGRIGLDKLGDILFYPLVRYLRSIPPLFFPSGTYSNVRVAKLR